MGQASTHAAATNTNPARDLYEIGFALKRAQHEFRLALNAELASLGTNISQLNVLRAIRDNPGISSAQLARNGFLTPQTLGQQVIQMQAQGFVERTPGEGRKLEHRITRAGDRLLRRGMEKARAVHARVLRDFDERELEALVANFRLIAQRASEARARAAGD